MLQECINSATALIRNDAEFILVDDASTDETPILAEKMMVHFGIERFVYARLESNSGAQVARNHGISLASGEFFLFLDSDDVLASGGVLKMLNLLETRPELDYVYAKVQKVDYFLRPIHPIAVIGSCISKAEVDFAGYHWHTMGAIYRRRCIERVGEWNTLLTGSQDWEYQARVKMFGGLGEFCDAIAGLWRQHEGARVGVKGFRPDYVRSVIKACELIKEHATSSRITDYELDKKLAKKIFVHAIEWGANGYAEEKKICLNSLSTLMPENAIFRNLCSLESLLAPAVDRFICKKIYSRL